MSWYRARQKHLPELISLLCRKEWENLHFSSRIFNQGKPRIPGRKGSVLLLNRKSGDLKAAVMIWDNCQIFPLFPAGEMTNDELRELSLLIEREAPEPFSLIGPGESVLLLLDYLWLEPVDCLTYRIMTLAGPYSEPEKGALDLKKAGSGDLAKLFPLEVGYQKEEVLRNPGRINLPYLRKVFSRQLKEQLNVAGKWEGTWVSKASTNARGFRYCQLGGIYTEPAYRGRKFGEETLLYILSLVEEEKRNVSLFVKENNPAARRLYEKTGFQDRGQFRIAYFL